MKKLSKLFYLLFFSVLILSMLFFPRQALTYSLSGLQLWFDKMIPALLPFMILSGIMVHLQINTSFIRLFTPILYPLFRLNSECLYVIFMGFLCGFPMGAKVCAQLYSMGRLTKSEAEYLLSFCNNIGPVYFVSFVLFTLQIDRKLPFLFGMYGLPILYGLLLRYTVYAPVFASKSGGCPTRTSLPVKPPSLLSAIDESVTGALHQITQLGGYMILFNVLNLIPFLMNLKSPLLSGYLNCLLEISGGISSITMYQEKTPLVLFLIFTSLIFGGLCCLAQTLSVIRGTGLSSLRYLFHKLVLWGISMVYYGFLLLG